MASASCSIRLRLAKRKPFKEYAGLSVQRRPITLTHVELCEQAVRKTVVDSLQSILKFLPDRVRKVLIDGMPFMIFPIKTVVSRAL